MWVDCVSWTSRSKQAAVLLGLLIAGSACASKEKNTRVELGISHGSRVQASPGRRAADDLATAPVGRPHRAKAASPVLPGSSRPGAISRAAPELHSLALLSSLRAELYPHHGQSARSLALGAKGMVFVSTPADDRVYALVDDDGDHKVDRMQVVAKGHEALTGPAYREGSLNNAGLGRLLRLDGIDRRLDSLPTPVVVTDELPQRQPHGWRYIRFGSDGWLYMPIGAPRGVRDSDEPILSSVSRNTPDGDCGAVNAHIVTGRA